MVGDIPNFVSGNNEINIGIHYQLDCSLTDAIKMANENISHDTKVLTLISFHSNLVYNERNLALVKPATVISEIVDTVDNATAAWKVKFPNMKVLCVMPHEKDFSLYNRNKAEESAIIPDEEYQGIVSQSCSFSAIYSSRIIELVKLLREKVPHVDVVILDEDIVLSDGFHMTPESQVKVTEQITSCLQKLIETSPVTTVHGYQDSRSKFFI